MGTEIIITYLFQNTSDKVEKMGPLRGDGNSKHSFLSAYRHSGREDGSPSWGRKLSFPSFVKCTVVNGREDGSPSWGRKSLFSLSYFSTHSGREDGSPSWGRKFCTGCALAEFSK